MAKTHLEDDPMGSVPQTFNQLGIFLIDGSGSMYGDGKGGLKKHQAVDDAVRGALTKFKTSTKRASFSFAVVVFGVDAQIHTKSTTAENIDDNGTYDPLNPSIVDAGGTNIGAGLKKCETLIHDFYSNSIEGIPNKVAVVVLSDGMSEQTFTQSIATQLKQNTNTEIYCCLFEGSQLEGSESSATQLLRSIASDPVKGYKTVYDPQTIRDFFIASVTSSAGLKKTDIIG